MRQRPAPQPNFPAVLDRKHPLASSVLAFIYPVQGAMWDAANQIVGVSTSTALVDIYKLGRAGKVGGALGGGGVASGVAAYFKFPDHPNHNNVGAGTIFARGEQTNFGSTRSVAHKVPVGGTSGATTPFSVGITTTAQLEIVRSHTSGQFRIWTGATSKFVAGQAYDLAISHPAAIDSAPTFWIDGVLQAAPASSGPGTGSATTNTNGLQIGRRPDGAYQGNGSHELLILFNRQLSSGEVGLVRADPYALLFQSYVGRSRVGVTAAPSGFQGAWAHRRVRTIGVGVH